MDSNENQSEREKSWDYCYGFFYSMRKKKKKWNEQDKELGCLHLWAFLASYGMLRGSSWLLQNANYKSLDTVIVFVASVSEKDGDYFREGKPVNLKTLYEDIEGALKEKFKPSCTLITKIMLGVWGCCPAYDSLFRNYAEEFIGGTGHNTFTFPKESLEYIAKLLKDYSGILSSINAKVAGNESIPYPPARIIDMYVWNKGNEKEQEAKKEKERKKHQNPQQ